VLGDLLAWSAALIDAPQVMYWRTASGREVDFVVEWNGRLLPVEVKTTARPRSGDADALRAFREEYGTRALAGLLLHTGDSASGSRWSAAPAAARQAAGAACTLPIARPRRRVSEGRSPKHVS
jgi:hypothetical protein